MTLRETETMVAAKISALWDGYFREVTNGEMYLYYRPSCRGSMGDLGLFREGSAPVSWELADPAPFGGWENKIQFCRRIGEISRRSG